MILRFVSAFAYGSVMALTSANTLSSVSTFTASAVAVSWPPPKISPMTVPFAS